MSVNTLGGRKAAVESGVLRTAGELRKQEFASHMRAATSTAGDKTFVTLDGYASTVNVPYTMYDVFGEYEEQIARSAFDTTLAAAPDVNFLINHTGMSMARTNAGTLELSIDDTGLRSVATLNPQRTDVQDLVHAVTDGNITEMSFAFRIVSGRWNQEYTQYTITEVDLNRGDVSAVNYGANPDTSISARAKQAMDAIEHLEGAPLRAAAIRAAERVAEAEPEFVPSLPNVDTLLRQLSLEE